MNEKLPPLPEPLVFWWSPKDGSNLRPDLACWSTNTGPHPQWDVTPYYTAEQVEAIRREAVMLCARVAEQAWLSDNSAVPTSGARAIRALLAAPDSRGQSEPAKPNEHAHPVIGVVLPSQSVRIGGEGEKLPKFLGQLFVAKHPCGRAVYLSWDEPRDVHKVAREMGLAVEVRIQNEGSPFPEMVCLECRDGVCKQAGGEGEKL